MFLKMAKESGINVGTSQGFAIVPAITGSSLKAAKLSNRLFDSAINVQPIVHPAVEEKAARIRFFLSGQHTEAQIKLTVEMIKEFA